MPRIIITGANEGIGYFMVEKFLLDGHFVAVLDVDVGRLHPLRETYPDRLLLFVCDVRDAARVAESVGEAACAWAGIDIAIHNACRCTFAAMEDTPEQTYRDVFDVNYFGALHLARAVLPQMQRQGHGRVIFTSSGVGVMGFPSISPYASSKGALAGLAKCLGLEYRSLGVTFHILHPPITRTRSSAPFPLPEEFKAEAKTVGYGLAGRIQKNRFVICHSVGQTLQTQLCYLFPLAMGRFLSDKMAALAETPT